MTPLLRAPPFPFNDATVSAPGPVQPCADVPALFALVREARVGGAFWDGARDPWAVIARGAPIVARGDDELVPLARIAGLPVTVTAPGRFGAPGDDAATLDRKAAEALLAAEYRDPFTGGPATIGQTMALLALWRDTLAANRPIVAACGMAWWKRAEIRRFLWHPDRPLRLTRSTPRALRLAKRQGGAVAVWPSRVSPALKAQAAARGVGLVRVEDGFVRSVGLGVELVPPSSVVVDASGIHFDPAGPSDLETILATHPFPPALLDRARGLRETIVAAGISKYGAGGGADLPPRDPGRRLVLVPGQVADDLSVRAGGHGLDNITLLERTRAAEPNAEIWFRPHPDVDAGHRKGRVADADALRHADRVVRGGGMAALLARVDAVHTITSLTGFEALLRGKDVTCHGTPFYAGWGLTTDLAPSTGRRGRGRGLELDALVAGVLILYPRYLDPVTGLSCPPEVLVARMAEAQAVNRLGWVAPLRRWQGRLAVLFR